MWGLWIVDVLIWVASLWLFWKTYKGWKSYKKEKSTKTPGKTSVYKQLK
jgi:threonine/homoserine/homoserine lactone efflux protein